MKKVLYIFGLVLLGIVLINIHVDSEINTKLKEDEDVVVAIIDTGIDYTHSDLKNHMWENNTNLPGKYGYDFMNEDDDPMDDFGHGTHCAGIVLERAKDLGVDENLKFMAIKYMDENGSGDTERAIKAYEYIISAKEQGVNIVAINNSWGVDENPKELEDLINKAGELGILSFNAAGNDGSNLDILKTFPGGYRNPYTITVAASTENDELASFSVYGENTVDIAALGTGIVSTYNRYYYIPDGSIEKEYLWKLEASHDDYYENSDLNFKNSLEFQLEGNEEFFGFDFLYEGSEGNLMMIEGLSDGMWMNLGTFLLIEDNFMNTKVVELFDNLEKVRIIVPEAEEKDIIKMENISAGKSTGKYAKLSGTSMATPNIIGSYLKVLDKNSDLEIPEVRNILLSKVRPLKGEKSVRGNGIFDFESETAPVLEFFTNGIFQGEFLENVNKLYINNKNIDIKSQTDTELVIEEKDFPLGMSDVVLNSDKFFPRKYKLFLNPSWKGYEKIVELSINLLNSVGFYDNEEIYLFGGSVDNENNKNIYKYNISTGETTIVGNLSDEQSEVLRIGASLERFNDEILVYGYDELNEESIIFRYDKEENSLEKLDIKMPGSKNRSLLKSFKDNLYLIGGIERVDDEFISTIWKYNEDEKSFESLLKLNDERFSPLAYEDDNKLFILGGLKGENEDVNLVEVFDGENVTIKNENGISLNSLKTKMIDNILIGDGIAYKSGVIKNGELVSENRPIDESLRDYFTAIKGKEKIYIIGGRKDLRPNNEIISFSTK